MTSVYLNDGSTLNSRKSRIRCVFNFPCKSMNCKNCIKRRRAFFSGSGALFAAKNNLDTHLIVSWHWRNKIRFRDHTTGEDYFTEINQWPILMTRSALLSKRMSGVKAKPYIRVLAIGNEGCPHIHFLTTAMVAKKVIKICRIFGDQVKIKSDRVYDAKGLLGYFFDQNFLPTINHPNKIKGIRLITASRPMPCGFPTTKRLKSLSRQTLQQVGIDSKINWNGKESCISHGSFS